MLTRIDHVMICAPELAAATETYRRIGFDVYPGGDHAGGGTHNAIAFHEEDYLELLSPRPDAPAPAPGSSGARLAEFLRGGPGFRYVAIQSDDLAADVAAMRGRGIEVSDPVAGGRTTPAGQALSWRAAALGPRHPLPIFFIQHETPLEERRRQVPRAGAHPNGVLRADRVYIAVADVAAAAAEYARVLGLPVPKVQRGGVIKADMAVFDLGPTGLTVAQPAEPGPAAEALARRGPGPFQVLYRTRSMDAAARWMAEHGMPAAGARRAQYWRAGHAGGADEACGAYIGFVGPA